METKKSILFIVFVIMFGEISAQNDSCYVLPEMRNNHPAFTALLDSVVRWTDCLPSDEPRLYDIYTKDSVDADGQKAILLYIYRSSRINSRWEEGCAWTQYNNAWFLWKQCPHIPGLNLEDCIGTKEIILGDMGVIRDYLPVVCVVFWKGEFWVTNVCGSGPYKPKEMQFPIHIPNEGH